MRNWAEQEVFVLKDNLMSLSSRQVHLDFHTSPLIPDVAGRFDPERFAETLEASGVNSVTCFARCHHGMLYYPSRWRPDLIHPTVAMPDLLNQQIEACHARGIRVPAYSTVQWDEWAMKAHPEWLIITPDGRAEGNTPLEAGFYRSLDVLHPGYRQFLKDHATDMLACCPDLDGLFWDIVAPRPSVALHHLEAMDAAGLDPDSDADRRRFARQVVDEWKQELSEHIRSLPQWTDDKTIFYNAGHVGPRHRATREAYSHYELESLPSGAWGYLHFPLSASYARTLGKPLLGQTAKFHTAWGDFHSYKNPAALEYEGLRMLAMGAAVEVGDQLHPDGQLDGPTYANLKQLFDRVRPLEPFCLPAEPVREVGILTPEAFSTQAGHLAQAERQHDADSGAVRLMMELRRGYDRIDGTADFGDYQVVLLPDRVPVDDTLAERLRAYIEQGGCLLASAHCGAAAALCGVTLDGDAEYEPDFLVARPEFDAGLPDAPHVMYRRGRKIVGLADGAEVLADAEAPYFNRSWRHFCSHQHAPSRGEVAQPCVVERRLGRGRCVYFSHPVFETYHQSAPRWVRHIVGAALDRLSPAILTDDGPVGMDGILMHQPAESRYVLHTLYYPAARKAAGVGQITGGQSASGFDVIEEAVPLHGLTCRLSTPREVVGATLQPQNKTLPIERDGDTVAFTIPRIDGHQAVVLNYATP